MTAEEYDGSRWKGEFNRLKKWDAEHPTKPGGVVFVGSSSILRWKLKNSYPDKDYLNRGFGGSEIPDTTHNFDLAVDQA